MLAEAFLLQVVTTATICKHWQLSPGRSSLLCVDFSVVVASGGFSLVVVCRLLFVVAPLAAEHGLQGARASVVVVLGLSSCGSWALERRLDSCGAQA